MLMLIEQLPTETIEQRAVMIGYALHNVLAIDSMTGAQLKRSRARRKLGRPAHYHVMVPNGTVYIHHFSNEDTRTPSYSHLFGLSASTDAEALAKANERLDKAMERFMRNEYCKQVREQGVDF
jgi:hypothetical protein